MVDEVGPEVRPVEAGGGSLEHAGGGGVTSVEVAHHCRPERSRYDRTVMKHDDRSHSDETVTVRIIILNSCVPGVLVLGNSVFDQLVEQSVLLT